ncbi:MAG: hypothetical protein L0Y79_07600 [Chlorobi bacterium]|nr:hypothetical protein [Chlorobiota bacterium]MCI0716663.1 hypothetical protein [Chlorobiota bacterium]
MTEQAIERTKNLFKCLFEFIGNSDEYFVTGSLSFLPLLSNYRDTGTDIDVGISSSLFEKRKVHLKSFDRVHILRLDEVAVASESKLAHILSPKTSFMHLHTKDAMLDISRFTHITSSVDFKLGYGLSLRLSDSFIEKIKIIQWQGIDYRSAPPELAFIPKAICYLQQGTKDIDSSHRNYKNLEDIKRLNAIINWNFIGYLLQAGGLHWLGKPLPKTIAKMLDPFKANDIMSLQNIEI